MANQLPKTSLLLFCLAAIVVACFSILQEYKKGHLREQLELLQASMELQRQQNLLQLDSLQQSIDHHQEQNLALKDSLRLLQQRRSQLTKRSNEKKAAISRIADVDSLYHEVAGHYR